MTTLRIVELEGGKYAVQKCGLMKWRFCSLSSPEYTWSQPKHVLRWCVADSLAEAERGLNRAVEYTKEKKGKVPRVVRVVRTVRV